MTNAATARHDSLGPRERQVCALLATGMELTDVATQLGITCKTVSTFAVRARHKLRLQNTRQLAIYANRQGWGSLAEQSDEIADAARTPASA